VSRRKPDSSIMVSLGNARNLTPSRSPYITREVAESTIIGKRGSAPHEYRCSVKSHPFSNLASFRPNPSHLHDLSASGGLDVMLAACSKCDIFEFYIL
jgi:hypothetical protein